MKTKGYVKTPHSLLFSSFFPKEGEIQCEDMQNTLDTFIGICMYPLDRVNTNYSLIFEIIFHKGLLLTPYSRFKTSFLLLFLSSLSILPCILFISSLLGSVTLPLTSFIQ